MSQVRNPGDKAAEEQKAFDRRLLELRDEIVSEKRAAGNEKLYKKYFTVKTTPVRGVQVSVNEEAVKNAKRYYGYFALLSNDKTDSVAAIEQPEQRHCGESFRKPQRKVEFPTDTGFFRTEPQL